MYVYGAFMLSFIIGLLCLTAPYYNMQAFAEADAFFCFVELLSGLRDNFVQQLDNSVVGIRSTITKLSQLLRKHDEELWRHLEITSKVRVFNILLQFCF